MRPTIKISPELHLPLEAITNTFAIFGIRGSGKSNIGAVMAEGIIEAGQPVCIIDPTGAWYGLKSSQDGKAPGLPVYIFGGEHADIPLEPTAGEVLANFMVDRRVPIVLDLKLMRKHEQVRFVMNFSETLFHRNREPLMVLIDEVARFAPQQIKDRSPDAARCLGAIEDLATLGRSRGLGVTLLAQRPAPVSTTLRTQIENLICLRTIGKHDRTAIDEWVEAKGTQEERNRMMKDLAELPSGTGYFWSPGWLNKFVRAHFFLRKTFDSGRTPKVGERVVQPKAFAAVDTAKLSDEIRATIERAKADDPKELHRLLENAKIQIETLKLSAKEAVPAEKRLPEIVTVHIPLLEDRHVDAMRAATEMAKEAADSFRASADAISVALGSARAMMDEPKAHPRESSAPAPIRQPPPPRPDSNIEHLAGELGVVERRVLDSLGELWALGTKRPPRSFVAMMSNYTNPKSGGFTAACGRLRDQGLIFYPDGETIGLMDEGARAANIPKTPATSSDLQHRIIQMIGGKEAEILRHLIGSYPKPMDRSGLGQKVGYMNPKSGGFTEALGRLRGLGFTDYPNGQQVVALPSLFIGS